MSGCTATGCSGNEGNMRLLRKKNLLCLCLFCMLLFLCRGNPLLQALRENGENACAKVFSCMCVYAEEGEPEETVRAEVEEEVERVVPKGLYAYASCLLDAENDRVLFENHGNEVLPMASTTKIMTLIVLLEHASMDEVVTVSKNAAAQPDVQLNIRTGEQYRLGDLVYSLMLESHNDVAVALAEHVGGSVEGFCAMMNAKAAALGLKDTCFETPNGLDSENHHTTAIELSKIASYAIKNPDFIKITNTATYRFQELTTGRSFTVSNKNRFLYMMDGAIGIKTGFTGKAGYCFVGALKRGEHTLIATMLACGWPPNKSYKWSDTQKLMNYGLTYFNKEPVGSRAKLSVNGQQADEMLPDLTEYRNTIPVVGGISDEVHIAADAHSVEPLLLAAWEQPSVEIHYEDTLFAPVMAGDVVGSIVYRIDEKVYTTAMIRTTESVAEPDFWYCLQQVLMRWKCGDF